MYAKWKALRDKSHGSSTDLPRVVRVQTAADVPEPYVDEAEISLYDILQLIGHYKALLLGMMLLAALSALTAAFLMTPVYRAEVLLAPVTDREEDNRYLSSIKGFGNIASLAGINLNQRGKKSEAIATLRSRKFSEQFIKTNQLDKRLFPKLWDVKQQRWRVADADDIPTLWDAYKRFDKQVRHVRLDRVNDLVTLTIDWEVPELAADWANKLVSSVNATLRQQAVDASKQAIAYLQAQLAQTSVVELQQVLHRLIEAEMKRSILANLSENFAFRVIDPAVVPEEPFKPKVVLMVTLATLIGLMLGLVLAVILHSLRARPDNVAPSA